MELNRDHRLIKAKSKGITTQERYEELLNELANIRLQKVIAYGERRYESVDDDFNIMMCYCDVYRKFIRLETLVKCGRKLVGADGEMLLDTYMDLANYAIMAVQVLEGRKVK